LSPRRPRRRRWRRRRPRRSWSPTGRTVVVGVPVMAVIPVPVVAPRVVPPVTRAPVMVIRGSRRGRRLSGARGQSEHGRGHAASRQRASAQAKQLSCLPCLGVCVHASENSPWKRPSNVSSEPQTRYLTAAQLALTLRRAPPDHSFCLVRCSPRQPVVELRAIVVNRQRDELLRLIRPQARGRHPVRQLVRGRTILE
jgi:hypothetical protein